MNPLTLMKLFLFLLFLIFTPVPEDPANISFIQCIGILKKYRGKGIGTTFFNNLDLWAKTNNIVRLELTVECCNNTAKNLYEKNGFKIEGIRKKSMFVAGSFVDEFYMAKIL